MADEFLKKSLSAELDRSRSELSRRTAYLKEDLAFGRKIKQRVAKSPVVWFGGAVLVGYVLSRLPARQKKVKIKYGNKGQEETAKAGLAAVVLFPTLKFIFTTLQPTLMSWLRTQFSANRGRG